MKHHKLDTAFVGAIEVALGVTIGRKWDALAANHFQYGLVLFVLLGVAAVMVWYWSNLLRENTLANSFGLKYLGTAVFLLNIAIYRLLSAPH